MLLALLFVINSSFANAPWSDPTQCARHVGLTENGKLVASYTMYSWYAQPLRETIAVYAQLHKDPALKLSFEHLQFTIGYYKVMRPVEYAASCNDFPELDAEAKALMELQKTRRLTPEDLKGGDWIHMISGVDQEEVGCINYRKVEGVYQGCGDIWQGGLTADEVVCLKGKNVPKCYVDCLSDIYSRNVNIQPGFCQ